MNFSPFGVPFTTSMPASAHYANAKFTQNLGGQVVGVLQGGEGGVHYFRPVDGATGQQNQNANNQTTQVTDLMSPTLITLPITMPGAKPGDPQQTVQIQVIAGQPQPKYQVAQLPIQAFQQQGNGGAVLTVAYNGDQQNGVILADGTQGLPEGVTVVTALQPHDLQLLQAGATIHAQQNENDSTMGEDDEEKAGDSNDICKDIPQPVALVKAEHTVKTEILPETEQFLVADYIQRMHNINSLPLSLHQFLKFNPETIKRESQFECSPLSSAADNSAGDESQLVVSMDTESNEVPPEGTTVTKKKKKYKKKPPKPKKPKPGQVHIVTALDGTTLFCCPECHMAYPEKELLEQHLVGHKIERRFICDICGAGLKRKEHLERHKLGHNPDRPFICSVCMKGFKRKEHLNLHYVIHSGEKSEICGECGKGFYRKDHLRKHARSHAARRLKEEMQQNVAKVARGEMKMEDAQQSEPHHLTIQVSSETMEAMGISGSNVPNTQVQVPVEIQIPSHHIINPDGDLSSEGGSEHSQVSTVVLPRVSEAGAMAMLHQTSGGQHPRSHNARRAKDEMQQNLTKIVRGAKKMAESQQSEPHHLTIQVTSEAMEAMGITTGNVPNSQVQVPMEIQIPHHLTNPDGDGSSEGGSDHSQMSTVVLPRVSETGAMTMIRQTSIGQHARTQNTIRIKEEVPDNITKVVGRGGKKMTNSHHAEHHLTIQVSNEAMEAMGISASNVPNSQVQVPMAIQIPQHHLVSSDGDDGSEHAHVSTVVLPTVAETGAMTMLHQTSGQQH